MSHWEIAWTLEISGILLQIAENYGGSIEVKDSELGGARFDVYLKKA